MVNLEFECLKKLRDKHGDLSERNRQEKIEVKNLRGKKKRNFKKMIRRKWINETKKYVKSLKIKKKIKPIRSKKKVKKWSGKYKDYLKTLWWEKRKEAYYELNPRRCYACKRKSMIDLHHCDYSRLLREKDSDLIPLCRKCHEAVHKLEKENELIKLKEAHVVYKKFILVK